MRDDEGLDAYDVGFQASAADGEVFLSILMPTYNATPNGLSCDRAEVRRRDVGVVRSFHDDSCGRIVDCCRLGAKTPRASNSIGAATLPC